MTTCVVLAAGTSERFGSQKLLRGTVGGETLLERAVRACGDFPTVVVCSPPLAGHLDPRRVTIVVNPEPHLGMAHSLQLAHARIDPSHAIAVLPADLALIEPQHVRAMISASAGVDVAYPRHERGTPGHPVIFSARARMGIAALPAGDTIRLLRDRPDLTRLVPAIDRPWPYLDVDRESDLRRMRAGLHLGGYASQ